jgi:L-lactate dehydrogenase (cytochrome)
VIDIFAKEMRVAMALSGCTRVEDISASMLENDRE